MEESQGSWCGAILLELHILVGTSKPKNARVCPRLLRLSTPLTLKKKIPYACPATGGLSQEPVQTQGSHPMSSIMDYPLTHISRFPRSDRGEEQIAVVEGKNRAWNVPGGQGIKSPPSSAECVGSIPAGRTEIPHILTQLSLMCCNC